MNENPLVSVIIPSNLLNEFFVSAVNSVLAQSYKKIEIIIVLNGVSRDDWVRVSSWFSDSRVKIYYTEIKKLTFSLNLALHISSGKYIARMDADDLCEINRLDEQVRFLQANPDVAVCGSFCNLIDKLGKKVGSITYPESNKSIRAALLWGNPLCHPSVLMKREVLLNSGGYDGHHAEDYALWVNLSQDKNIIFANIPMPLISYRSSEGGHPRIQLSRQTKAMVAGIQYSRFIKSFNPIWLIAALFTMLKVIAYAR
jgi:cellulose synthase/poly-beta-1,6-N-acetylglucosamine synthase-like glycosyltransferase